MVMVAVAYTYLVHIELETIAVQTDSLPGVYYGTQIMSAWLVSYALTQDYVLQEDRAGKQILESKLQANRTSQENLITKYETTIKTAKDRELFDTFKNIRGSLCASSGGRLKGKRGPCNQSSGCYDNQHPDVSSVREGPGRHAGGGGL